MNILIIDNDFSTSTYIKKEIRKLGYHAETASSGRKALNMIERINFHAILLDLSLPDMNCPELISLIKEGGHRINIITMTAFNSRNLELSVRKHGIDYYMIKPFDIEELRDVLHHITRRNVELSARINQTILTPAGAGYFAS